MGSTITEYAQQLEELHLFKFNLLAPCCSTFPSLGTLTKLRSLSLQDAKLGNNLDESETFGTTERIYIGHTIVAKDLQPLADALLMVPQLQQLNLSDNGLNSADMATLGPSMGSLNLLQVLVLRGNMINNSIFGVVAVSGILTSLPLLQRLDLGYTGLEREGLSGKWLPYGYMGGVQLHTTPLLAGLSNSLLCLDLSGNMLGSKSKVKRGGNKGLLDSRCSDYGSADDGADDGDSEPSPWQPLTHVLNKLTRLEKLQLCDIDLEGEKAGDLKWALGGLTRLKSLGLSTNTLGPEGASALAWALGALPQLEDLDLDQTYCGAEALAGALVGLKQLKSLRLNYNNFRSDGASKVVWALVGLTQLQHLEFEGNELGPDGACELAEPLEQMTQLTALMLSNNELVARSSGRVQLYGAKELGGVLGALSRLQRLDLSSNDLQDEGLEAFAPGLVMLALLTKLSLNYNLLEEGRGLVLILRGMPNLVNLDLEGNHLATALAADAGLLSAALNSCPCLEDLGLSENGSSFSHKDALAVLRPSLHAAVKKERWSTPIVSWYDKP